MHPQSNSPSAGHSSRWGEYDRWRSNILGTFCYTSSAWCATVMSCQSTRSLATHNLGYLSQTASLLTVAPSGINLHCTIICHTRKTSNFIFTYKWCCCNFIPLVSFETFSSPRRWRHWYPSTTLHGNHNPNPEDWWWRQHGHLKHWYPTTTLHGITNQKTSTQSFIPLDDRDILCIQRLSCPSAAQGSIMLWWEETSSHDVS